MNSKDCNCFCLDTIFDKADFHKTFYLVWTLAFMYMYMKEVVYVYGFGGLYVTVTLGIIRYIHDVSQKLQGLYWQGCTGKLIRLRPTHMY